MEDHLYPNLGKADTGGGGRAPGKQLPIVYQLFFFQEKDQKALFRFLEDHWLLETSTTAVVLFYRFRLNSKPQS